MKEIYVFLGPSLPLDEARAILPASYLPPVTTGDVYALVRGGRAGAIGIVDGVFDQAPAVWHKEILYALSQGVPVYGAASMGALRAAELHPFGMVGVGEIFAAYRSGAYEDDDEVAVAHAPVALDYRPLSEAMVNLREGLRRAAAEGLITPVTHEILVQAAKRQFYPDRAWPALLQLAVDLGVPTEEQARLREAVRRGPPNVKRSDAVALLQRMRADAEEGRRPEPPAFHLERSFFFEKMVDQAARSDAASGAGPGIGADALLAHVNVTVADRRGLVRAALLLHLVSLEARRLGVTVDEAAIDEAVARFLREHGLDDPLKTHAWLHDNHIRHEEFSELMRLDALCEALAKRYERPLRELVQLVLKRGGAFGALLREAERKWDHLRARDLPCPTPTDAGLTEDALLAWYERRFRAIEVSRGAHAAERGFDSLADFLSELAALYLYERAAGGPDALPQ